MTFRTRSFHGRNPAYIIASTTYQLVQDFFHPPYLELANANANLDQGAKTLHLKGEVIAIQGECSSAVHITNKKGDGIGINYGKLMGFDYTKKNVVLMGNQKESGIMGIQWRYNGTFWDIVRFTLC